MGAVRLGQGAPTIGENPRPDAISDSQTVRPCLFSCPRRSGLRRRTVPAELPSAAAPTPTGVGIRVRLGGSRAHPPPRTASRAAPTLAGSRSPSLSAQLRTQNTTPAAHGTSPRRHRWLLARDRRTDALGACAQSPSAVRRWPDGPAAASARRARPISSLGRGARRHEPQRGTLWVLSVCPSAIILPFRDCG